MQGATGGLTGANVRRSSSGLQLIDTEELIDYPLDLDERMAGRFYMAWHHDRWLNSRFRLSAPADVRGLAFDLFCLAQKQTPIGTLPDDDVQLAALLMLDLKSWQQYRNRPDWSPLYHWSPCRCGPEIRLMHSVVLEVIDAAITLKAKRVTDGEIGRRRKRLERLPAQILDAGGSRGMGSDGALLDWLDGWLQANCAGNRTRAWVIRGLEVWSVNMSNTA